MSMWGFVAHFALPPPLILTALLVLPSPRIVREGVIAFTRSFLFAHVVGSARLRLVHFMLLITGAMFAVTAVHTARIKSPGIEEAPHTRISMLGYKWRQERNFWISALCFILWALLYRLLQLMLNHETMRARVRDLEKFAGLTHHQAIPTTGKSVEASAPPMPSIKVATAPPAADKKGSLQMADKKVSALDKKAA